MNRFLPALLAAALVVNARAAAPLADDPRQILIAHEAKRRTQSDEYVGELIVTAKNGKARRKEWHSYHEGYGPSSSRLIRFLSPPDVRGVGYLRRQRPGQPVEEWLYLPSMQRERRVVQSDRQSAFVGTDFSYDDLEDLEILNQADYDVSAQADRTVAGLLCHAIELRPRLKSEYEKKVLVIRKDTLSLMSIEYFRKGDRAVSKTLTMSNYQEVDQHLVAMQIEMADAKKGSTTRLTLRSVALNRAQPPDRFTIQNLVREDDHGLEEVVLGPRAGREFRAERAADTATDGRASDRPAARVAASVTGYVEGEVLSFFAKSKGHDSIAEAWGDAFLRASFRILRTRVNVAVRAEDSTTGREGPVAFDPADRLQSRSPLSMPELALVIPVASGIDVQLGRFPVAWGESEHLSPADAFLPRDTSKPLVERLPIWGALLRGERGGVRFEALFAPTTTPWRLPELDGRHSPGAALDIFLTDLPSSVPRRGFGAVRVSTTRQGWDVGVWARSGIRPAPVMEPHEDQEVVTDAGTFIPVGRRYAQENAIGVHLSRPAGAWLVETEVGVLRSPDPDLGRAVIFTFNASRPFRNGTFLATFAINLIPPPVEPLLLFDRALLPAAVIGTQQYESWGSWRLGWLGTYSHAGGLLTIEIVKNLTPVLKLTTEADLPHGDVLSPARAFTGNKRARVGLRWEW